MKRVAICTGKATSLMQVASDILKVFERSGYIAHIINSVQPIVSRRASVDGLIIFYPADPIMCLGYASWYLMLKKRLGDKLLFYTTIEGKVEPHIVNWAVWKNVDLIANSKYTYRKLAEAGFNVVDIIYHGVDFEEVKEAKKLSEVLRKKIENDFPNRVYFSIVSSGHRRKGWDSLIPAIQMINKKYKDKVAFFVITTPDMFSKLNIENVYIVSEMGKRPHIDVLALLGAVDFHIQASYSEGFGLPLLEAMAMGTPSLHPWYEPLSEFSSKEGNIYWYHDYIEIMERDKQKGTGINFELHYYEPSKLAEAIEYAIDIKLNKKEEYENMSKKVEEKAREYDIMKVYKRFVDMLS
ncbi:hypothetical protein DRN38_00120 [Thermococci archaeon]|nr:MAG: hypothetical protein DRN38_00120 [Thermococci archaeon]